MFDFQNLGRLLLIIGGGIALVGLLFLLGGRFLPWLGRLARRLSLPGAECLLLLPHCHLNPAQHRPHYPAEHHPMADPPGASVGATQAVRYFGVERRISRRLPRPYSASLCPSLDRSQEAVQHSLIPGIFFAHGHQHSCAIFGGEDTYHLAEQSAGVIPFGHFPFADG